MSVIIALLVTVSNVLTADVPRATVNPDAFLVSAGDHNVVEVQNRASRILSVPSFCCILREHVRRFRHERV